MHIAWNSTSGLMTVTACFALVLTSYWISESDTGNPPLGLILVSGSVLRRTQLRRNDVLRAQAVDH
jgi:hypothetical protein